MRAALDWSYRLLDAGERAVFRSASVFAGGATLDALEAVHLAAFPHADVLRLVARLVDHSLLLPLPGAPQPRVTMLETARQYGRELLAEHGEEAVATAAHAGYYLAMAEQAGRELHGPDHVAWLDRLERELDNLRTALVASRGGERRLRLVALDRPWHVRGHVGAGHEWAGGPPAQPERDGGAGLRAGALEAAAGLAWHRGDLGGARGWLEEALAAWRPLADLPGVQRCLSNLGVIAAHRGDWTAALALGADGLGLARDLGDDQAAAIALCNLGLACAYQGDHGSAHEHLDEALQVMRRLGDAMRTAVVLVDLGTAALYRGADDEARERYASGLRVLRSCGIQAHVADCLEGLACIAARRGRVERAVRLVAAATSVRDAAGMSHSPHSLRVLRECAARTRRELCRSPGGAWREGRELRARDAIELALEESARLQWLDHAIRPGPRAPLPVATAAGRWQPT
jgi:non-specific serine/threonine protein kinase